eukprot:6342022-Prymnesium_polylepis.1
MYRAELQLKAAILGGKVCAAAPPLPIPDDTRPLRSRTPHPNMSAAHQPQMCQPPDGPHPTMAGDRRPQRAPQARHGQLRLRAHPGPRLARRLGRRRR